MFLILSSYTADLIFGDPEWFPHPVRAIGKLINFLDKHLRGSKNKTVQRLKGAAAALFVVGITMGCVCLIMKFTGTLNSVWAKAMWIYLGFAAISAKDLWVKAKSVLKRLKENSIVVAQEDLSKIVGRDTRNLDENKIITAAIESIAENTSDGIVAPLFYLIIGGPVLAFGYKAVNTLDSMIGYKNEKYIHFGWFAARLDDAANFIPSRITGFLIALSAFCLKKKFRRSFGIMLRDGRKHPSPNSGISEAAMAGALGIRLGGTAAYEGIISEKPYIGEDCNPVSRQLISEALKISFCVSVCMVLIGEFLKWARYVL